MAEDTKSATPVSSQNAELVGQHISLNAPHFARFAEQFEIFPTSVSHADHHDTYNSALSPAAYLVDLLRLAKNHIPGNDLFKRRPDLEHLPLDRAHTEELVPYLEVVNTAIAAHVKGGRKKALSCAANSSFPFTLPANLPLLQIRTYLAHFDVELIDIYETLGLSKDHPAWIVETLGLSSQSELTRLGTPDASEDTLQRDFGGVRILQDQEHGDICVTATFMKQTGLSPAELSELVQIFKIEVRPEIVTHDKQGNETGREPQCMPKLKKETLDRLNRFIRLAGRTGWSFSDLDWALRSANAGIPGQKKRSAPKGADITAATLARVARIKRICDTLKLPVDVVCCFVQDMKTTPGVSTPDKVGARSLFDRTFNTPPFSHPQSTDAAPDYHPKGTRFPDSKVDPLKWTPPSAVKPAEQDDTGSNRTDQDIGASLQASLGINSDDLEAIVDHLCEGRQLDAADLRLDVRTLTILYRHSKLAHVLKMEIPEFLVFLKCIAGKLAHNVASTAASELSDVETIIDWAGWLGDAGLHPYQLEYLLGATLSARARSVFDPGPAPEELAALLPDLEPWTVLAQSFTGKGFSPDEAHGVCAALTAQGQVDTHGLCRETVSHGDVIETLAAYMRDGEDTGFSSAVGGLVTIQESDIELALRAGPVPPDPGTDIAGMAGSVLKQLVKQSIVGDDHLLAAGSNPLFARPLVPGHLLPKHPEPDMESRLGQVRAMLASKANKIGAVVDTVNQVPDHQYELAVHRLAAAFHLPPDLASAVLEPLGLGRRRVAGVVSGAERNNVARLLCFAKALGLSPEDIAEMLGHLKLTSSKVVKGLRPPKGPKLTKQWNNVLSDMLAGPPDVPFEVEQTQSDAWVIGPPAGWTPTGTLPDMSTAVDTLDAVEHNRYQTEGGNKIRCLAASPDGRDLYVVLLDDIVFRCRGANAPGGRWERLPAIPSGRSDANDPIEVLAVVDDTLIAGTSSGHMYGCPNVEKDELDWSTGHTGKLDHLGGEHKLRIAISQECLYFGTAAGGVSYSGKDVWWDPRHISHTLPRVDISSDEVRFAPVRNLWATSDDHTVFCLIGETGSLFRLVDWSYTGGWHQASYPVDPADQEHLILAADGAGFFTVRGETRNVFRCKVGDDENLDWQPLDSDVQHQNVRAISPLKDGISLLVATDHGIYHVVSSGADWKRVRWVKFSDLVVDSFVVSEDGKTFFAVGDQIHRFHSAIGRMFGVRKVKGGFKVSRSQSTALDSIDTMRVFHEFFELARRFKENAADTSDAIGKLGRYLLQQDAPTLQALSGWNKSQTDTLLKHFAAMPNADSTEAGKDAGATLHASRQRCAQLTRMQRCFDLAARSGVDVTMLTRLCKLHHEVPRKSSAGDGAETHPDVSLDGYTDAAQSLLGVLRSKYSEEQWAKTFNPIRDHLNELERDTLSALLLGNRGKSHLVAEALSGKTFETLQELSGYLLLDTEMSGNVETSHVKAAIGTLQTYIERCRLNIEDGIKLQHNAIPDTLWAWMGHYRMWEANRKVFFYPENYIEPTQRKQATPLFKELQSELLQGEVTDEAVTAAYINYFDKLDELANLQIVDGHVASVTNPNSGEDEETIFVIGRTSGSPPVYYVRSATLDRTEQRYTGWRPWQKIDLTVPTDQVAALFAHNRLYIFWIEWTTQKQAKQGQDGKVVKHISTAGTIKYSYQKVSGAWLPPQTLSEGPRPVNSWDEIGTSTFNDKLLPPVSAWAVPVGAPTASLILTLDYSMRIQRSAWIADTWRFAEGNTANDMIWASRDVREWNAIDASTEAPPAGNLKGLGGKSICATVCTPDGRILFAATVKQGVWQANTGPARSVEGWRQVGTGLEERTVSELAIADDGNTLFAATTDKGVVALSLDSDYERRAWEPVSNSLAKAHVTALLISEDGENLFAGEYGGKVWRATRDSNGHLERNWTYKALDSQIEIRSLALTPDGKALLAGAVYDGKTKGGVWKSDLKDDGSLGDWELFGRSLYNRTVYELLAMPGREALFAGTKTGFWQMRLGVDKDWRRVPGQSFDVGSLAAKSDESLLYAGTIHSGIRRFAFDPDGLLTPGQSVGSNLTGQASAIVLTPDEAALFCGSEDDGVQGFVLSDTSLLSFGSQELLLRYFYDGAGQARYTCGQLNTRAVHDLRRRLVTAGLDSLLSIASQRLCAPAPADQSKVELLSDSANISEISRAKPLDFDLSDPYAIYFREIFFHIPFLIADALQRNQQFEHARKWYQYVLDPTRAGKSTKDAPPEDGMWRFLPFRENTITKLNDVIKSKSLRDELAKDPFDPHAIAAKRLGAYEKAVAMKYLDNLLDWGDMLFAMDNWEAINQAAILYVRALNLLGAKPLPQQVPASYSDEPKTAEAVASGPNHEPHHPDLADVLASTRDPKHPLSLWDDNPFFDVPTFFSLPENKEFAACWDRAQDRLYKIRHSMNIEGVVRQLALFQPPIDPSKLVQALASGGSVAGAAAQAIAAVPHHRFSVMLRHARSMTETVIQLGGALLSALEKEDAEALNLLHTTEEQAILKLSRTVQDAQIEDAEHSIAALKESRSGAQTRIDHFQGLIDTGQIESERTSLALTSEGLEAQKLAHVVRFEAVVAHLIPTVFGFADGDFQPGSSISEAATLSDALAGILGQKAAMVATGAQYERRAEDWGLQKSIAEFELSQINSQIESAMLRLEVAKREIEVHEATEKQAEEREKFFRRKYTSKELYQWIAGRVSMVYFQTYKLAVDLARSAERAYQYECNADRSFIDFGQWDSRKKGLQAGEALMLGLNQLEKAHLEDDRRELELNKFVSLLQLDPDALMRLKLTGSCTFKFNELLFAQDHPGHYCRRIKSVSVSIPAVVGPNQNINATLTQENDQVLMKPESAAVGCLLSGEGLEAHADIIRTRWRPSQQIAISTGLDDSGTFQLDFQDEHYLPFERTGALSTWKLSLLKAANRNLDFSSISDVVIHLRYTALYGGDKFRSEVVKHDRMKTYSGQSLHSLRQGCSSDWHRFVARSTGNMAEDGMSANTDNKNPAPLRFSINAADIAFNCSDTVFAGHFALLPLWKSDADYASPNLSIRLSGQAKPAAIAWGERGLGVCDLPETSGAELSGEIVVDDANALEQLADIVLIVDFRGTLTWD